MVSEEMSRQILQRLGLLRQTESDTYMVSCPFHKDSDPSCSIHIKESYYNCFSCGKAGPLTKLYKELTHHSIREDFKNYAWESSYFQPRTYTEDYESTPVPTFEIEGQAVPASESKEVMDYLYGRGLTDKVIKMMDMKASAGFRTYNAAEPEEKRHSMSFKDRVLIPIQEGKELLAMEGRYIKGEAYWNETHPGIKFKKVLYPDGSKVSTLYDINSLDTGKRLYICEGTMDLAVLRDSDRLRNSTCVLGASIGERQCYLLARFPEIVYVTDNDMPGKKSYLRLVGKMEAYKRPVLRLPPPLYLKDIGDLNKGGFRQSMDELLDKGWLDGIQDFETAKKDILNDKKTEKDYF